MANPDIASETLFETSFRRTPLRQDVTSPLKRMMAGLTSAAAVLAMVLATALPAQAGKSGDDLAKALAAALVTGLVIAEVGRAHDRRNPVRSDRPRVPEFCAVEIRRSRNDYQDRGRYGHGREDHDWYGGTRFGADRYDRGGTVVYRARCLREYGFAYRLPNCGQTVRFRGHRETVFTADCLRSAGFRVGRR